MASTTPPAAGSPSSTDEIQRFDCDSVILAVGETVDLDFVKASGLALKESGTIEVNRFTLETSRRGSMPEATLVTGASNVSNAMAYGKQAARNIDLQLMEADRWEKLYPAIRIRADAAGRAEPEPASHRACAGRRRFAFARKTRLSPA